MELYEIIKTKNSNIGGLCLYIKNREILLNELKSHFLTFNNNLTIAQMCWYIFNNVKEEELCLCNNHKKWKSFKNGWRETCGDKQCYIEKRKQTNLKKYGVDNPQKCKTIKNKTIKTYIMKYGVDNPAKNIDIKNKILNTKYNFTNEKKYKIYKKIKKSWSDKTSIEKQKIIEKRKQTWNNKTKEEKETILLKRSHTMLEKYGYKTTFETPIIKDKINQSLFKKFKNKHHFSNSSIQLKRIKSYKNILKIKIEKKLNGTSYQYIKHYFNENKTIFIDLYHNKCKNISSISYSNFKHKLEKNNLCKHCYKTHGSSLKEKELFNYIKTIYKDDIIHRYRIDSIEVDIFIPKLNLAFEFNGLYWHSELFKDKNYHLNKTNICKNNNIKLIHIWEDDWTFKHNIIKSRIRSLFNMNDTIYARKCIIKNVNNIEAEQFFTDNHLQNFISTPYYIGLYYQEKLVQCMCFSKNENGCYLLNRFCSILNYNIIGGVSKILKYFIKNYNPDKIISYFDRSWGHSNIYKKIGFVFENYTNPSYYYIINKILRTHSSDFKDNKLFNTNNNKIYDCGLIKFTWKKLFYFLQ